MPSIETHIPATDPGTYFLEDDGIPGNNRSQIRYPNGNIVTFEHPTDNLSFTGDVAGVTLVVNLVDPLGAAKFTVGQAFIGDPFDRLPDAIVIQSIETTGIVTLFATGSITETADSDA